MKKAAAKTKSWAIYLMVFTTFIATVAQLLLKRAADNFSSDIISSLLNINLIGGLLLASFGGILLIIALKNGELSIIYPIVSLSFVWIALISHFFFNEILNLWQYAGIFIIILGVVFLGVGNKC